MSDALTVWWVEYDGELTDEPPDLFTTLDVAKEDAVRVYRDANGIGQWPEDPEPVFAWIEKRYGGGIELHVDAEASGIVVRPVTVWDAAGSVRDAR